MQVALDTLFVTPHAEHSTRRILIAAPTHSALDSVAERLIVPSNPWVDALLNEEALLASEGHLHRMKGPVAEYERNRRNRSKPSTEEQKQKPQNDERV